jgi:3-methyladenine DNA glycosylase AlkD
MINKEQILDSIRETLSNNTDPLIKSNGKKYFKEKVDTYGVKVSLVTKISKDYFEIISGCTNYEIYCLCEQLFQTGFLEDQFIACNWSYYVSHNSEPEDFNIFENW